MHCLKEPSEEKILEYAETIVKSGMPVGTFIIDAWWEIDFGELTFKDTFTNPKKMLARLHELGFEVMLWVCPFISPDSAEFRYLEGKNMLGLKENTDRRVQR